MNPIEQANFTPNSNELPEEKLTQVSDFAGKNTENLSKLFNSHLLPQTYEA